MTLLHDVRYAARSMRRSPGFSAVAILILAVGIGGTTSVYSVIDPLLIAPLRVPAPGDLVLIEVQRPSARTFVPMAPGTTPLQPGVTRAEFERLRAQSRSMVGAFLDGGITEYELEGTGAERRDVRVGITSAGTFETLRLVPALGRLFVADDERLDAPRVVVISHAFWSRAFGSDPGVVGREIRLTRRGETGPVQIVGVASRGFAGIEVGVPADIWMLPPTIAVAGGSPVDPTMVYWRGGRMMGRLQPGMRMADAQAELAAVFDVWLREQATAFEAELTGEQRDAFRQQRLVVSPGARGWGALRTEFARPLFVLLATAAAVLLIACANVAGLILAQGATRRREIAVCLAVGSSRARLIRQQLVASLVLAFIGGAAGFIVAAWMTDVLVQYAQPLATSSLDFGPNLRVLSVTVGCSLLSAAFFGVVPALRATRLEPNAALRYGARGGIGARQTIGRWLVPAQIAVTLVVVVVAGLFIRSLSNLQGLDLGFDRDNVIRVQVNGRYDYANALARLEQLPGVVSATAWTVGLMSGPGLSMTGPVIVEGEAPSMAPDRFVPSTRVGPHFFQTMGIALLHGRDFTADDSMPTRRTVIVSEAMARQRFGTANAVGRRFRLSPSPGANVFEVVGVAENARYFGVRENTPQILYSPLAPGVQSAQLAIRVSTAMATGAAAIGGVLRNFDPQISIASIRSVSDIADAAILRERFLTRISTALGALGLLLAAVGLYGTLAYSVTQRTSEIAVRMALGARAQTIAAMVLRETGWVVGTGIMAGVIGARVATQAAGSLLFGLSPADPATIVTAGLVLTATASLAASLPTRRAIRIEPIVALRHE